MRRTMGLSAILACTSFFAPKKGNNGLAKSALPQWQLLHKFSFGGSMILSQSHVLILMDHHVPCEISRKISILNIK